MPRVEVTTDEWLAELESLRGFTGDQGLTVQEICQRTNRGQRWVRERLMVLKQQGRLIVGRRMVEMLCGNPRRVPVYRLKPKGK